MIAGFLLGALVGGVLGKAYVTFPDAYFLNLLCLPGICGVATSRLFAPIMRGDQFWFFAGNIIAYSLIGALIGRRLSRRLKVVKPGHCARCEYDLTGNVSGVCPECGKAITTSSNSDAPKELDRTR